MSWLANRNIGWNLALAFCLVIVLGLSGYWNVGRAMNAALRHNRTIEENVNVCVSRAQDAAIQSHDTAANTVQFVYSDDPSDREHKWETNGYAQRAFSDLSTALVKLPNNARLMKLAAAAERQEEQVCNPQEDRAITLADNGHRPAAIAALNGPYLGDRYRMELNVTDLITQLGDYQKRAEDAQTRATQHAIRWGWLVQGLILLVSASVAVAISRHTSATVAQTQCAQAQAQESDRHLLDAQRIAQVGNWQVDLATG